MRRCVLLALWVVLSLIAGAMATGGCGSSVATAGGCTRDEQCGPARRCVIATGACVGFSTHLTIDAGPPAEARHADAAAMVERRADADAATDSRTGG